MTTVFPSSPVALLEARCLAQAKAEGFALFAIKPEGKIPGFVYSVGMSQHDLHEVIYFYPEGCVGQAMTDMRIICSKMIAGSERLGRIKVLSQMVHGPAITGPSGHSLRFGMLTGDSFIYALKNFLTRTLLFRNELGMPRGVLVAQRADVPTFGEIRDIQES